MSKSGTNKTNTASKKVSESKESQPTSLKQPEADVTQIQSGTASGEYPSEMGTDMDAKQDEEKINFLVNTGLLEAYEYCLRSLCKAGLPDGNVYEYAALKMLKFEKKFKAEKRKKDLLEKYKENQLHEQDREKVEKKMAKEKDAQVKKLTKESEKQVKKEVQKDAPKKK